MYATSVTHHLCVHYMYKYCLCLGCQPRLAVSDASIASPRHTLSFPSDKSPSTTRCRLLLFRWRATLCSLSLNPPKPNIWGRRWCNIYIYICIFVFMCNSIYIHIQTYRHTYIYTYIHTYIHVSRKACMRAHLLGAWPST